MYKLCCRAAMMGMGEKFATVQQVRRNNIRFLQFVQENKLSNKRLLKPHFVQSLLC